MSNPRMPEVVRSRLAEALKKIANGPSSGMAPHACDRGTYEDGFRDATVRHAGWRNSWIEHELRQVLAWADGEYTATEINVYGLGADYQPGSEDES